MKDKPAQGEMTEKRVMKKVYYDPAHPGSFGGVERLRKAVEDETG